MSAPKSVTKIVYKNGKTSVEFTDNVAVAEYEMFELTRGALRDVGKFVAKKFMESYDAHFPKRTGKARKSIKCKVWSSRNTQYPRVEIGIKGGYAQGTYSMMQEFGSYHTQRLGLLTHAVEDNIPKIIEIESQYLEHLQDESTRLNSMINENEIEVGVDE